MRRIIFVPTALLALLIAACGSDSTPTAQKREAPADKAGDSLSTADRERPTVLTPRRMRGSADEEDGDSAHAERRDRRDGWGRERSEEMAQRMRERRGELSPEERAEMIRERAANTLQQLDEDGDGRISRAEAEAAPRRLQRMLRNFDEIDTDSDGFVSAEELAAAQLERRQRFGEGRRGARGERRGRRGASPDEAN